jgi:catechol 2,3-dioxygenase-like lactoylglutathione lyase family enzyme
MTSSLGQCCLNVADLDAAVGFYTALGLTCTSRTEIPQAHEAIVENPAGGGKLQLARQKDQQLPLDPGNAFWKLYVDTYDLAGVYAAALGAGATVEMEPTDLDRWPVTVAFVRDLDGFLVEIVERHPWPDDAPPAEAGPWLGQFCVNVSDIEASVAFYELLGLTCSSRTEIPQAHEAILENTDRAVRQGKLQLAQQLEPDGPLRMGAVWKLYVDTDDCHGLHGAVVDAGHTSLAEPMRLDRWPVTIAFVADPDGYQVELVERHPS